MVFMIVMSTCKPTSLTESEVARVWGNLLEMRRVFDAVDHRGGLAKEGLRSRVRDDR
jgi:hypothetical protein